MIQRIQKAARKAGSFLARAAALLIAGAPVWAAGGGRLAATQAMTGLSSEVSGPLAYGASLITVAAVSWYRPHHDMSHLGSGAMGTLFVAGVACGAASLLGFVPRVAGAVI